MALHGGGLVRLLRLPEQDGRVAPPHADLLVPEQRDGPADQHERHGGVVHLDDLLRLNEVGHLAVGVGAAAEEARAEAAAVAAADERHGDAPAGDYPLRWDWSKSEAGGGSEAGTVSNL